MLVELQVAKLCSPIPNEVEKDRVKIVFGLLDAGLLVSLIWLEGVTFAQTVVTWQSG